jgi:hypothetical protein
MTQIGRPSRGSRGASVLETVRARSGGGFSGNHSGLATSNRGGLAGDGSRRLWPSRLRLLARTCLRRCAPTRKRQTSVRCLCDMPQPRFRSARRAASRPACIVFRGLAPLVGERTSFGKGSDRQRRKSSCGSLGETPAPLFDRRSRSVQVSRGWLACSELAGLLPAPKGVAQARVAPVTAPPGKGCHWPAECVTVWFVHAF